MVGRRLTPFWRVFDDRLRAEFIDSDDTVPSVDVHSETFSVADRTKEILLPAFKFASIGN